VLSERDELRKSSLFAFCAPYRNKKVNKAEKKKPRKLKLKNEFTKSVIPPKEYIEMQFAHISSNE
jgi:hypothetical protein